jgi:hypothetical protein
MEKNVNAAIKQIRINKGFKTRDLLMRSVEKYCKDNKQKVVGEKTIQRMENDLIASEYTISVVSKVLNITPEDLKINVQQNSKNKIPEEVYSTINLKKLDSVSANYFKENFNKTGKRKFIIELGNNVQPGQVRAVQQFVKYIDDYADTSNNVIDQIMTDDFGSSKLVNDKLAAEHMIDTYLKAFKIGNSWQWEGTYESAAFDAEKLFVPSKKVEKSNPIYIYYDSHPYATYWPVPSYFYENKIEESAGGGFSKFFDGSKPIWDGGVIKYDPSKSQKFILAPVTILYSLFFITNEPNISQLTYRNMVSKIVLKEWERIAKNGGFKTLKPENQILGKQYEGLFDNILKDILGGIDGLPKNYLEDSDFTKIYLPESKSYDYDDYYHVKETQFSECYDKVINHKKFFNYMNWCLLLKKTESLTINSPENKNKLSREKWLKKRNAHWVIGEDIEHLVYYLDSVDEAVELILTGGEKLTEALNKSRPPTLDDI